MSEFDEARLAAVDWIRAQMDRYGLSLDDLEAAGCFAGVSSRASEQDGGLDTSAVDAPANHTPHRAAQRSAQEAPQQATAAAAAMPSPPASARVLYRNALGQTWDGTGDMPDWLQRAVNAGQTPEFYRVE